MSIRLALLATIGLLAAAPLAAEELPPGVSAFLAGFRTAARSGDPERIAALGHPAWQACAGLTPGLRQQLLRAESRLFGGERETEALRFEPLDRSDLDALELRLQALRLEFPAVPEGRLRVRFAGAGDGAWVSLLVARSAGAWHWAAPCRGTRRSR